MRQERSLSLVREGDIRQQNAMAHIFRAYISAERRSGRSSFRQADVRGPDLAIWQSGQRDCFSPEFVARSGNPTPRRSAPQGQLTD